MSLFSSISLYISTKPNRPEIYTSLLKYALQLPKRNKTSAQKEALRTPAHLKSESLLLSDVLPTTCIEVSLLSVFIM